MDDPYSILGLAPAFDIDPAQVQRAYLTRAQSIHPDVAGNDESVAVNSALLNLAKKTLLDAESRARALFDILGGKQQDTGKALPPGFLAEMMATREEIEEALASDDKSARARWQRWANDRRASYTARLRDLFRNPSPSEPAVLRKIGEELNAWRYIERLIEQLEPGFRHAAPHEETGHVSGGGPG